MYLLIALSVLALFVFPLVAHAIVWFVGRVTDRTSRPEPSRHRESSRRIPGGKSHRSR